MRDCENPPLKGEVAPRPHRAACRSCAKRIILTLDILTLMLAMPLLASSLALSIKSGMSLADKRIQVPAWLCHPVDAAHNFTRVV